MGTDNQSMLMLLQAPELDIVGIGIVAGDGQVKASTPWTLRMLELTGTDMCRWPGRPSSR